MTGETWNQLCEELMPGSMVICYAAEQPVATACALVRPGGWREIAWLAVDTAHRGGGLGTLVCATLLRHLLGTGEHRVFGSTQDERLAALRLYLRLGCHPVYRPDRVERWRRVCDSLGSPYTPKAWGWPE